MKLVIQNRSSNSNLPSLAQCTVLSNAVNGVVLVSVDGMNETDKSPFHPTDLFTSAFKDTFHLAELGEEDVEGGDVHFERDLTYVQIVCGGVLVRVPEDSVHWMVRGRLRRTTWIAHEMVHCWWEIEGVR